jgi:hypothetical protein
MDFIVNALSSHYFAPLLSKIFELIVSTSENEEKRSYWAIVKKILGKYLNSIT